MNGRIRKIVNQVGDLQKSAPFEQRNVPQAAAFAGRKAAQK
jgi:hypothetical protein